MSYDCQQEITSEKISGLDLLIRFTLKFSTLLLTQYGNLFTSWHSYAFVCIWVVRFVSLISPGNCDSICSTVLGLHKVFSRGKNDDICQQRSGKNIVYKLFDI